MRDKVKEGVEAIKEPGAKGPDRAQKAPNGRSRRHPEPAVPGK